MDILDFIWVLGWFLMKSWLAVIVVVLILLWGLKKSYKKPISWLNLKWPLCVFLLYFASHIGFNEWYNYFLPDQILTSSGDYSIFLSLQSRLTGYGIMLVLWGLILFTIIKQTRFSKSSISIYLALFLSVYYKTSEGVVIQQGCAWHHIHTFPFLNANRLGNSYLQEKCDPDDIMEIKNDGETAQFTFSSGKTYSVKRKFLFWEYDKKQFKSFMKREPFNYSHSYIKGKWKQSPNTELWIDGEYIFLGSDVVPTIYRYSIIDDKIHIDSVVIGLVKKLPKESKVLNLPVELNADTLQWDGGLLIRASPDMPRIDTTHEWLENTLKEIQLRTQAKWNNN